MADNYITGAIGGVTQPIFIGTPGLPGATIAGASNFLNPSSSSTIGNVLGNLNDTVSNLFSSGSTSQNNSSSISSSIADYFFRGVIIILGFIFMAVGLSMFKPPTVIMQPVNNIKRAGHAIRKHAKG